MGERYKITGVQLALLVSTKKQTDRNKIYNEIVENQFLGNESSCNEIDHVGKALFKLAKENYNKVDIFANALEEHLKIVNTEEDGEVFQSLISKDSYEELIKKIEDSKKSYA